MSIWHLLPQAAVGPKFVSKQLCYAGSAVQLVPDSQGCVAVVLNVLCAPVGINPEAAMTERDSSRPDPQQGFLIHGSSV